LEHPAKWSPDSAGSKPAATGRKACHAGWCFEHPARGLANRAWFPADPWGQACSLPIVAGFNAGSPCQMEPGFRRLQACGHGPPSLPCWLAPRASNLQLTNTGREPISARPQRWSTLPSGARIPQAPSPSESASLRISGACLNGGLVYTLLLAGKTGAESGFRNNKPVGRPRRSVFFGPWGRLKVT
jgi:hypothetical protein